MRVRLLLFVSLTAVSLACVGCGDILGLGDYTRAPDAGDGSSTFDASSTSDGNLQERGLETGDLDAADSGDAGCVCAVAPPMGWGGPLALWTAMGSPPPMPPSCAGDYVQLSYDGYGGLQAPPASCGCTCGAPAGATCGNVTITAYSSGCSGGACATLSLAPGGCANTTLCGSHNWDMSASTASGGTCTASPSKTVPAWSWSSVVRACGLPKPPPQGSCGAGELCVSATGFPFQTQACIAATGDVACPAAPPYSIYSVRTVYYSAVTDTRDCAACTCGGATGVDCNANAHVQTWDVANCANGMLDDFKPLPQTCKNVDSATKSVKLVTSPAGGSCQPSAAQSTGVVTPLNPTTICCTL